ncbi:MAG: diacylglycerol kinase family protein [Clostridiales bacterium]|nr:diacylglycerol kinase family protein [Clostridiales bacterium]
MKKKQGIFASAGHAFYGLFTMIREERNLKLELLASAVMGCFCVYFRITRMEAVAVTLCCTLIVVTECMNTAMEEAVDLESPGFHPLAKRAKDFAAGAVLLSGLGSIVVGLIIFLPYIGQQLRDWGWDSFLPFL